MADLAFASQHNMVAYLEKTEGGGDSLVRAATTARLDAQQDNSNIAKTQSKAIVNEPNPQGEGLGSGLGRQETMGGAMAQIKFEGAPIQSSDPPFSIGNIVRSGEDRMTHAIQLTDPVPQTPHDSPLSGGHKPGSDEGSMTLKKLTDLCTTISQKVLDMKNVKIAQAMVIVSLQKRVTKMEQIQSLRISSFHPFRADVIVEDKGSGEKGGSTSKIVSTASLNISVARSTVITTEPKTLVTTTLFDDEDVTIADTLVKIKSQKAKEKGVSFKDVDDSARPIRSITTLQPLLTIDQKDKGKGILQEPKLVKKTKKRDQDQIERDFEVALKIQAELDKEVMTKRERQKKASKAALAELCDEVQEEIDVDHELAARLTHEEQEKYTVKERSKLLVEFFERRKKLIAKERANENRSKPPTKTLLRNLMMTYLKHTSSEEDEKRVGSRKKRAASSSLKHKSPKKQNLYDQESVDSDKELRKWLKVVPDDDKAMNYETLDIKSPIINCESQVLGTMKIGDVRVYKLTRLNGSYRHFSTFSRMLEVFDIQDVLDFHKIVMERFPANDLEGYDLILWGDLKTLMESSKDDEI
uniref:Uncharacterized protein n=1 Tax=Tanacetum cinerariifolium TaxID=118510 RepID=A0A699IBF2_TANCI|nr:hypothetical protein [Tanacetum cinerariifolium]